MNKIGTFLSIAAIVPMGLSVPQVAMAQNQRCNSGNAAVAGAVLGGLLGGFSGRNHGRGLLIGSAIGAVVSSIACMAINSKVTKQRTNEQVQRDYQPQIADNQVPTLISYSSAPDQPTYQLGQQITIRDRIIFTLPQSYQNTPVSETFTIKTPTGDTKTFTKPIGQSGGDIENELSFQLPNAMPRGIYTVNTQISVSSQVFGNASTTFQVA